MGGAEGPFGPPPLWRRSGDARRAGVPEGHQGGQDAGPGFLDWRTRRG